MGLIFKCPGCDNKPREIEQIMSGCIVAQVIHMDENGDPEYGDPEVYEGFPERFQCKTCGYHIGKEDEINQVEELYDWLKERQ